MSCIGFDEKEDCGLHDMYAKKLLIPGWAGEVTDAEARYIGEELSKSAQLRRTWGVKQFFGRRWKHISSDMAKRLCAAWAQNPTLGVKGLSGVSGEKDKDKKDTHNPGIGGQMFLAASHEKIEKPVNPKAARIERQGVLFEQ